MFTRTHLVVVLALGGCSASYSLDGPGDRNGGDYGPNDTGYAFDTEDVFGGSNGGQEPGPEEEDDSLNLRPAQTDIHVFVANPDRDTVTRINVRTLEVRTVRVGRNPRVVAITPNYAKAVVFNRGDDSVTVITASTLATDVVSVRDNLTNMVLAPDGATAILWHDPEAVRPDDPSPGGAASYHELSIVGLETLAHTPIVAGFIPTAVRFTPDGATAVIASDSQLAVIDLRAAPPSLELVEIADPLTPPHTEEIVLSPNGKYAFLRQRDVDAISIVDLESETVDAVAVDADPTDLDLTPDGTRAIVVSRGGKSLSIFDVADPYAAPRVVPFPDDTPLGSVLLSADDTGILYTTATLTSRYATWDLASDEIVTRPLVKPASVIARTPTGESLLVVHSTEDASDGSTPVPYRGVNAVSLVSLSDNRANTIALSRAPLGFANSADGERGYLVLDGVPLLEVLDYRTLIPTTVPLRSNPVFVGVLPSVDAGGAEPPAWVSQEHPLGRISFYDALGGSLETITGFELNSAIED